RDERGPGGRLLRRRHRCRAHVAGRPDAHHAVAPPPDRARDHLPALDPHHPARDRRHRLDDLRTHGAGRGAEPPRARLRGGGARAAAWAVPLDPPPSGPADGEEPPRQGGVLREASSEDPRTLDPAKGYDTASWGLEQMIFNTLVDYDAGTNVVPELAESWTI